MIELTSSAGTEDERTIPRWFHRRTNLERKLLVASIFVGVVLIGFIVDASISSDETTSICTSRACILASSQIIKQVDNTVKPCENFFKYACGKLKERTHHKNIPHEILYNQVKIHLLNILEEPIREDDHQAIKDEKILFQACINEKKNGVSLEMVKSLLKDLNGWPVLMGTTWNEEHFHWSETIIKLRSKGFRHTMLFRNYLYDGNETSPQIIEIRPTVAFEQEEQHLYVYKNYLIECAVNCGANETDASTEMGDVFQFVLNLDRVNRIDYNNVSEMLTLPDFQARYPEVNWMSYFSSMLSPKNITLEDLVSIPIPEYMGNFLQLMHNTTKRTLANYILWYAIGDLMPLISESSVKLHKQVACITGYYRMWLQDNEECQMAMRQIFSPRPSNVNYGNKYFSSTMRNQVQNIFNHIFLEFKNVLKLSSWLDEESYRNASKWFDDIRLVIGTPEDELDKVFGKYKPIDNIHQPFLKIYLDARKRKRMQQIEAKDDQSNKYQFMFHFVPKTKIVYVHREHIIMIPTGFLQGMYYNEQWPMYLNFGGLGKAIGAALSYELTQTVAYKVYENRSGSWTSHIYKGLENLTSCLTNDTDDLSDSMGTNNHYLKQHKMAEINGIRLAYQAYKKWLEEDAEDSLIGLDYTPEQLFWIWTFSYSCYDETDQTENNLYTDNEVVRHNVHFATDFICEPNSKMNRDGKCNVF